MKPSAQDWTEALKGIAHTTIVGIQMLAKKDGLELTSAQASLVQTLVFESMVCCVAAACQMTDPNGPLANIKELLPK
jgi:hypothetical protein